MRRLQKAMGRARRYCIAAVILISATPGPASAQQLPAVPAATAVAVQNPAPAAPAERAKAVFDKHCARCHEAGRAENQAPNPLHNVLALDDIVREATLVKPGLPDASPLYTVMVSGHVPLQVYDATNTGPSSDEIDDVRGWIEGLAQAKPPSCPERRPFTLADEARALDKLRGPGGEALKGIRFLSLASYHNACASTEAMEARRRAVAVLIAALRTTLVEIDLPLAGDGIPVLAVRLGDMGWDASQWDALAADAGAPQLVDAASIAAFGTATPLVNVSDLAAAALRTGKFPGLTSLGPDGAQFLREGSANVDLARAAADMGLPADTLFTRLTNIQGPLEGVALALRQGSISALAWRELRRAVSPPTPAATFVYAEPPAAAHETGQLSASLWTDKLAYKLDELLVLTAQANRDCNLTVVNVDTRGEATVLYPSDSDPDNAIKAGSKVRIPSDVEPYQLRATEAGTETFIAICTLNRKRVPGIDQDFERQRFSVLGNWRTFLKTAATRESLIGRRDTPRQRRAKAKAATAAPPGVLPPEQEARTAIYVKIE